MIEFTKAAVYDKRSEKPAHNRLVDIEYIGTLCTTSTGTLELGDRYLDEILTKLIKGKDPFKPFAGRVRLIVEEYAQSSGIPAQPEKEADKE